MQYFIHLFVKHRFSRFFSVKTQNFALFEFTKHTRDVMIVFISK